MSQLPVPLDFPDPAGLTASRHYADLAGLQGTFTKYAPAARVVCEECVWTLHEARGKGPLPRGVRVKASFVPAVVLLCGEHAELWKLRARHV